jgi:hypothetical protein
MTIIVTVKLLAMAYPATRVTLAVQIALLIERLSRNIQPAPPKALPERLQFNSEVRGLDLEQALYAARKPPTGYEFIREDEHFKRVERLLRDLE